MNITEQRLAEIVGDAIAQALSERRKEVISHVCFCSDPASKKTHDEEHAAMRRVMQILDRAEQTKWAFGLFVLTTLAGAAFYVLWLGAKACIRD